MNPQDCTADSSARQPEAQRCGVDIHVAGVLVHARSESLNDVRAAVCRLPNAEVTHQSPDGKLVLVLEAQSARAIVDQVEAIRLLQGVLNVALVYQHAEPEEDMNQEIHP